MPKRKKKESKEAVAIRQRHFRERERAAQVVRWHVAQWLRATQQDRLLLAECQRRIADWERTTGQNWLTSKALALNAWYRDVGLIPTWRYPLVILKRRGPPVDRTGEPWGVRLSQQVYWEHYWDHQEVFERFDFVQWYRKVTGKDTSNHHYDGAAIYYYYFSKSWGRIIREVLFEREEKSLKKLDMGTRWLEQRQRRQECWPKFRKVPASRAAGDARSILITPDVAQLYIAKWEHELQRPFCQFRDKLLDEPDDEQLDTRENYFARWESALATAYEESTGFSDRRTFDDDGKRKRRAGRTCPRCGCEEAYNGGVDGCPVPCELWPVRFRLHKDVSVNPAVLSGPPGIWLVRWLPRLPKMVSQLGVESPKPSSIGYFYFQRHPGWAGRWPLVAHWHDPAWRSFTYWHGRLSRQPVEVRARALSAKCELLRTGAFCKLIHRKEKGFRSPVKPLFVLEDRRYTKVLRWQRTHIKEMRLCQ
jgi:hypothetical protein